MKDVLVIDDFLPDADAVREMALAAPYFDFPAPDGQIYRRVWIGEVPGVREAVEQAMGRTVDMLGMGFRLNFAAERPNAAVHSDIGWGTHALVLYLCDGEGGTAFWRHVETGATELEPGDVDLLAQVSDDWNDENRWSMRRLIPLAFNRGVIYPSKLFHSRYPFEAFGTAPEDGRLIAVAFFS